jgi:hypothetical protein
MPVVRHSQDVNESEPAAAIAADSRGDARLLRKFN